VFNNKANEVYKKSSSECQTAVHNVVDNLCFCAVFFSFVNKKYLPKANFLSLCCLANCIVSINTLTCSV